MKRRLFTMGLALLLAGCSLTPVASRVPGYLTTPKGRLLQDADGHCWRTADWRPALAIPECDPEVVAAQEALAAAEEDEKKAEEAAEDQAEEAEEPAGEPEAVATEVAENEAPAAAAEVTADVAAAAPALADGTTQAAAVAAAALADSLGTAPAPEPRFRDEVVFEPLVLNSDASFYFGDDHLTAEGQAAVAEIATILKLRRASELRLTVTGHTDRVGTDAANLSLSRRRAQAVKVALVAAGLPAASIATEGKGASKPMTTREQCSDRLVKCELIACLKPDRRVEIRARGRLPSGTRRVPVQGSAAPAAIPRAVAAPADPVVCRAG